MSIYEEWVRKVIASWKTKKQAMWIIQKQFERSWIFKEWTSELTKYGKLRDSMTEEERAISRVDKAKKIPSYKLKYVWWRVLIKNIYKKW